jgi:hypothetical protein
MSQTTFLLGNDPSNTSPLPKPFPTFCAKQMGDHKLRKLLWVNLTFYASS